MFPQIHKKDMVWINKYCIFVVLITFIMLNSFQTLQPNSVAPSLHSECDKPSGLGFNFMKKYKKILPTQRFGKLTVIERVGTYGNGDYKWRCVCDCGKEKIAETGALNYGQTNSCGCLQLQSVTKHGQRRRSETSSEYISWRCMINRCYSPQVDGYEYYGAKGISVCDRWRLSFSNFFEDMGQKPSKKHTIERDDVFGNYEPANCRWATQKEQDRNKSNSHWIEYNGEKMIASDWARKLGISCGRFLLYIKSNGLEKAVKYFTDKSELRFNDALIKDIYTSTLTTKEISIKTGISMKRIRMIKNGETFKNITNHGIQ